MGRAKLTYNDNDYKDFNRSLFRGERFQGCGKTCGKVSIKSEVAEAKANCLIEQFNAPQCRLFFLKCIYHLPEWRLEEAVESAMRPEVKSHIRYFTVVAKKALTEEGY